MPSYVMAIDQGTTSSRSILFDDQRNPVASSQKEITQYFPRPGQVEHDALEILESVLATARDVVRKADVPITEISCIGITNQRETCVVWERSSGKPVHRAIVWQDRRTADFCEQLSTDGSGPLVEARTGLLLDPYFSATKIAWILDNVAGARQAAENGDLLFGTIDSWLIWNLTGRSVHATDATNASRTSLFDIEKNVWDEDLLKLFRIPRALLPDVRDSAGSFGETVGELLGARIPICGVAGDQQAATVGQGCLAPGRMKATYGTGCFVVLNTGDRLVRSKNRMLSTIGYRIGGRCTYALEGSIFVAGAAIQWLRDSLKLIASADEAGFLAAAANPDEDVYLVPAFTGLGAPHWKPAARGAMFGLTRSSGIPEIARATLRSVCFQTRDLLTAMVEDYGAGEGAIGLRVDGGMAASDWAMQALADCLAVRIERPLHLETTALGAAMLAGAAVGVWPDLDAIGRTWVAADSFEGRESEKLREIHYRRWRAALNSTIAFANEQ